MTGRRHVEAEILDCLEKFARVGGRLPATLDGKVNVIGLCRELGLAAEDAQHFHRKDSIKAVVNAMAGEQGLLPIGARAGSTPADLAVERRIKATESAASRDARASAESAAAVAGLSDALSAARAEIERLRSRNAALEERIRLLTERGISWVAP